MSNPKHDWWKEVTDAVDQYPAMVQLLRDTEPAAAIAQYGPLMSKSGAGRALERTAIKRLSDRDRVACEAVDAARRETLRMWNGEKRLAIIDMVHWKRSHTLAGAGMVVGCSEDRAKQINGEFIRLSAYYLGKIPRSDVKRRR